MKAISSVSFHAAKNAAIAIAIPSITGLLSDIHFPIAPRASPTAFMAVTNASPVHDATGARKLFHSHWPRGLNPSIKGFSTENAPESRLKNAGTASDMAQEPKGTSTSFQNHFNPSPIFLTIGSAAFLRSLNPFIAGSNRTASFSNTSCIFVNASGSPASSSSSGATAAVSAVGIPPAAVPPISSCS